MRQNSEIIGRGNADAGIAMIDAQRGVRGVWIRFQKKNLTLPKRDGKGG